MYFLKFKDFINLHWRLGKDILEVLNSTWIFMVIRRKKIFSLMVLSTVSKIFITLNAESFQNLSKIFILFLASKTPTSKLVKVKKLLLEPTCYGNWKFLWFIRLKFRMECMKLKINKIFYWQKIFYWKLVKLFWRHFTNM